MKGKVFFSNGKVAEAGSTGILNINGKKMKITLNKENIVKLVEKGIVDLYCNHFYPMKNNNHQQYLFQRILHWLGQPRH